MKTSKTTLVLAVICVAGGVALTARFFADPPPTPVRPSTQPAAASGGSAGEQRPGAVVRSAKGLKLDKSANVIPDLDKEARSRDLTAKEALESKFRNWRDDGRKQFEEIFQGDRERTGAVMRSLFQNEQFRAMFQQTRELEAKWPKATDDEKTAIMGQMEAIRAQGLGMVRAEAARQAGGTAGGLPAGNNQGTVIINSGTLALPADNQPTPPAAAPAAPAPAPVIIM
ncbi:MAG: hypothetical protein ACKO3A_05315 [Opitutia bacterium]